LYKNQSHFTISTALTLTHNQSHLDHPNHKIYQTEILNFLSLHSIQIPILWVCCQADLPLDSIST